MDSKGNTHSYQHRETRQSGEAQPEGISSRADLDLVRSPLKWENHEVQRTAEWDDFFAINENFGVRIPWI